MNSSARAERREALLLSALIAAAVLAAFSPALGGGFLYWDDAIFVGKAARLSFDLDGLRRALTALPLGQYVPLTSLSFLLDFRLWGADPAGYHLTNLLWHAAAGAVWFGFWKRLLTVSAGAPRPRDASLAAAAAALLFCLHPLRVESVAWLAERRDVLCGFFYALGLRLYLESCVAPRGAARWRAGALAGFALSLLSKPASVTLPVTLLILDVYPLGRLPASPLRWLERSARPVLFEKIPFFLLSAAATAGTLVALKARGLVDGLDLLGPAQRLTCAAYSLTFYLRKELWPFPLLPFYELPRPFFPFAPVFLLWSASAVVAVVAAWRLCRKRAWLGAASAHYAAALLPVSGLIGGGVPHLGADRFSYFPSLAFSALAAGGLYRALARPRRRGPALLLAAFVLAALGGASWRRCRDWKDDETLWGAALAVQPDFREASLNLSVALSERGRRDEAAALAERAAILAPNNPIAWSNLGAARLAQSRWTDAETDFRTAARLEPKNADARRGWSRSLLGQGRAGEALTQLRAAAELAPEDAVVRYERGNAELALGRTADALASFGEAEALDPALPGPHANRGLLLEGLGRDDLAEAEYRAAVSAGRSPEALYNWGNLESRRGRRAEALRLYAEALRLEPDFADARFNDANELVRSGLLVRAAAQYRELLRRRPGDARAAANLRAVSAALRR